jgi:hypothetical protein
MREIVVAWRHQLFFPFVVGIYRQDGTEMGLYLHRGYLDDGIHVDLDNDGKEELLLAGTNNSPRFQGATVVLLDGAHCSTRTGAGSGACARLVIPKLSDEFMQRIQARRLHARDPVVSMTPDGAKISFTVGRIPLTEGSVQGDILVVTTDGLLRPLTCYLTDGGKMFLRSLDAKVAEELLDPERRNAWMATWRWWGPDARAAQVEGE